eukprot:3938431-Prymnesium_polylepis.1
MSVASVVCSARARRTLSPRPRAHPTPGMPRRRLAARAFARPAAPAPRPNACEGGARPHCPVASRVRTPNTLSPPRGGPVPHAHAPRPVPRPHRTTSRSPRR